MFATREFEIDRLISDLIGKIVAEEATPADKAELQQLMHERSNRMVRGIGDVQHLSSGHTSHRYAS